MKLKTKKILTKTKRKMTLQISKNRIAKRN